MHHEVVEFSFLRFLDDRADEAISDPVVPARWFDVDTLEHARPSDELLRSGYSIDHKEPRAADGCPVGPREKPNVRRPVRLVPRSKLGFELVYPLAALARLFDAPPIAKNDEISEIAVARSREVNTISHAAPS